MDHKGSYFVWEEKLDDYFLASKIIQSKILRVTNKIIKKSEEIPKYEKEN